MVALFAFIHHFAAFALVAALAVELVLIKGELNVQSARKLLVADLVFGVSASVVLVVGLLRVFYFEKGASYYFHSVPFIVKFSLFALVGLLSIILRLLFSLASFRKQRPLCRSRDANTRHSASCIGSWSRCLDPIVWPSWRAALDIGS
jgi:uncharacterized membrane protein